MTRARAPVRIHHLASQGQDSLPHLLLQFSRLKLLTPLSSWCCPLPPSVSSWKSSPVLPSFGPSRSSLIPSPPVPLLVLRLLPVGIHIRGPPLSCTPPLPDKPSKIWSILMTRRGVTKVCLQPPNEYAPGAFVVIPGHTQSRTETASTDWPVCS